MLVKPNDLYFLLGQASDKDPSAYDTARTIVNLTNISAYTPVDLIKITGSFKHLATYFEATDKPYKHLVASGRIHTVMERWMQLVYLLQFDPAINNMKGLLAAFIQGDERYLSFIDSRKLTQLCSDQGRITVASAVVLEAASYVTDLMPNIIFNHRAGMLPATQWHINACDLLEEALYS